jgi:kynurenine formamidase
MNEGMRIFDLEQPRTEGMPIHPAHQQSGYSYLLHRHHEDEYRPEEAGPRSGAAGIIICGEHTGTHIDALCHQADDLKLFGGISVDGDVQSSRGFTRLAVEEIPPILAPGVLLDIAAKEGVDSLEPGYAVTDGDLEECCERQGVGIEPADVVLVRTGNARHWEDAERYLAGPGIDARASYWLADREVQAVGADNTAWDVPGLKDPELGTLPGHLILLARRGIYIVENLNLEELAAAGHYRFDFICTPLKFVGATGSPVRPLAIVRNGRTAGA